MYNEVTQIKRIGRQKFDSPIHAATGRWSQVPVLFGGDPEASDLRIVREATVASRAARASK